MSKDEPPTSTGASDGSDWSKVLEWIEKQGQESLASRFATAESISKETSATLTVFLAAIGAALAYAAKVLDAGPLKLLPMAAAVVCAYLVVLTVVLVVKGMRFKSYPARAQQPKNLLQHGFSLDELREEELINLNDRIVEAKTINDSRAANLNRVRVAAALTPVVFIAAVLAGKFIGVGSVTLDSAPACEASFAASAAGTVTFRCRSSG